MKRWLLRSFCFCIFLVVVLFTTFVNCSVFNITSSINIPPLLPPSLQLLLLPPLPPLPPQVSIQRNTLGEYWWNKHIDSLSDTKMELLQSLEKSLKIKQKALMKSKEVVTEEMVKQRMGVRYDDVVCCCLCAYVFQLCGVYGSL